MIAYLTGTVLKKLPKGIVVNTGNVGYLVHISESSLQKITENESIELFIHTKVREDDISLYGFETGEELDFFKTVLNVNGIGPRIALEILSHDLSRTKGAILSNDLLYLTKIQGIGKKTAERIVIELKNKLDWAEAKRPHHNISPQVNEESVSALLGLGYQKFEVTRVLKDLPENIIKTEEIITYFLQNV